MKTRQILRPLSFLIPSAVLIRFGLCILAINAVNYQEGVSTINNKGVCNGKPCYCTNERCSTVDDLSQHYVGYFEWSTRFVIVGGIIIGVSLRWWK